LEQRDAAYRLAVCQDHLELAIDIFVDEYEVAPDIMDVQGAGERFVGWSVPSQCARCEEHPRFVICSAEYVE
jgi:CxxH/CxxC protein (TIGR04129 family)